MATKEEMTSGLSAMFHLSDTVSDEADERGAAVHDSKSGRTSKRRDDRYETTCFMANREKMNKIREIARRENLAISDIMEAVMGIAISAYESKYGVITVCRERRKAQDLFDNL
jgi:hypothetical protein